MLTSGLIGGFGDVLCQGLENSISKEKKAYNFHRTKTFFIMGTFFVAPLLHMSYSHILPRLVPEISATGAIKKLALDQLVFAPLVILLFYPAINIVEGRSLSNAVEDLKNKYVATMIANYKIWPLANLINFYFIPIQYQVLWANLISLIFNACLSYLHNSYKGKNVNETPQ
eukprot:403348773